MTKLQRSRLISRNLKSQIYQVCYDTHGSETLILRKIDENAILLFERKVLRKMYGPRKDESIGEWRIRKNWKIQELYQRPSIKEDTTKKRLK